MPQIATFVRQSVVRARRVVLIGHALEDACLHEVVEAVGEDVAGDPEAGLEIVEPGDAEERVAHDEEAPPFADDFEALRDRTVQVSKLVRCTR